MVESAAELAKADFQRGEMVLRIPMVVCPQCSAGSSRGASQPAEPPVGTEDGQFPPAYVVSPLQGKMKVRLSTYTQHTINSQQSTLTFFLGFAAGFLDGLLEIHDLLRCQPKHRA